MSELHYVTLADGEPLINAMMRWDATLPAGALNVFCYRRGDEAHRPIRPRMSLAA